MRQLRTLLKTYREAGGEDAIVLLHDGAHGGSLINALARLSDGLPANVLPHAVNEVFVEAGYGAVRRRERAVKDHAVMASRMATPSSDAIRAR